MRLAFIALFAFALPAGAAEVTGTAFYRERIALPPGAVFEAVLEDVSRADAPAVEISRDAEAERLGPPFDFVLAYEPAAIDPAATYAVRAQITLDGKLLFASDTHHPVITGGAPTEVEIPMIRVVDRVGEQAPGMRGVVTAFADAPRFVDCTTGAAYPVAMEADFPALERAVLEGRSAPEAGLLATFEGVIAPRPRMEGEGEEAAVVVERFAAVWPGLSCAQALADPRLTETYWRILSLRGTPVPRPADRQPEARLILRSAEGKSSFSATVGCNQLAGGLKLDGAALELGPAISTMMACPPPLDALERALTETLVEARGWRVIGPGMELLDGRGRPIALFEAVALP